MINLHYLMAGSGRRGVAARDGRVRPLKDERASREFHSEYRAENIRLPTLGRVHRVSLYVDRPAGFPDYFLGFFYNECLAR